MLDRLLADWPLKILALVIAFGIWVSVTGESRTLTDLEVPLDVRLRDTRILAEPLPTAVTVRLGGPATVIRKLDPLGLAVRLDLQDAGPGQREIQFTERHLTGVPRQVEVIFFEPDRLSLAIERRERRELAVEAEFLGIPPEGYQVYRSSMRPVTVVVEGPESAVGKLTRLKTNPIPLGSRRKTFTETVDAVLEQPGLRIVDPQPLQVQVVIDRTAVQRTFEAIPVELVPSGQLWVARPATVPVTLSGPPELLERLDPAHVRVIADTAELDPAGVAPQRVGLRGETVDLLPDQAARVQVRSLGRTQVRVERSGGEPQG